MRQLGSRNICSKKSLLLADDYRRFFLLSFFLGVCVWKYLASGYFSECICAFLASSSICVVFQANEFRENSKLFSLCDCDYNLHIHTHLPRDNYYNKEEDFDGLININAVELLYNLFSKLPIVICIFMFIFLLFICVFCHLIY